MNEKVAVVTGAASGIGAACADHLIDQGWQVHGWDVSTEQGRDGVIWTKVDVSNHEEVAETASRISNVDLLVNAAGVSGRSSAAEMTIEEWHRVVDVDLHGVFYCCRALYPALAANGGVVVNIASITGYRSGRRRAHYCVSKAGVIMLTQVLAAEWAEAGVRVLGVAPGYTKTPMVLRNLESGNLDEDAIVARTPIGRLGEPSEIAKIIVSLAGDEFSLVAGSIVAVDGGWLSNNAY